MTRVLALSVLMAVALAAPAGLAIASSRPIAPLAQESIAVRVDTVRGERAPDTVPVLGRLIALRAGVVAGREAGIIAEMRVDVGDRVGKGDVLAVLSRDRMVAERELREAEIAEAQAAKAAAAAEFDLRRQELFRIEQLRTSPAFSEGRFLDKKQEVEMARARMTEAQAIVDRARAQLRLAEISLADASIHAPFAGVVTKRHTEVGAHVNVGDPLVTLLDDQDLEIEAEVPADRLRALTPNSTVRFELGDRPGVAVVRAVVPEENPMTRTRTVRLIPKLQGALDLAANRSVTLHVPTAADRPLLTVHKDAVLTRGAGATEVVIANNGVAEVRPVRLGNASGNRFEVLDGLAAGDLVVIRGNERLRSGQRLTIERADHG